MSISPRIALVILLMTTTLVTWTMSSSAAADAPVAPAAPAMAQGAGPVPSPTPAPPTTTQPAADEISTALGLGVGIVLLALAAVGAKVAGVFRPGSIRGPLRLAPGSPVLPILLIFLLGGACWFGGQILFFVVRAVSRGGPVTVDQLDAFDLAILATVPALVALLIMLAGDVMSGLLRPIGLRLSRAPRMALVGFGSGIIGLLLVYGCSYPLGVLYELVNFEHPTEHELLGAMRDASPTAKALLVIGACVMAPLFEELLFRGHMQTLLTRLFTRAPARPPAFPGAAGVPFPPFAPAAIVVDPTAAPPGDPGAVLPMPPPLHASPAAMGTSYAPSPASLAYASPAAVAPSDSSAMRWLAVILTSLVFALIHPLWTAPLIFLLSLALGYAYERTGSLWVPIVMHAMFNISSTVQFLNFA